MDKFIANIPAGVITDTKYDKFYHTIQGFYKSNPIFIITQEDNDIMKFVALVNTEITVRGW